MSDWTVQFRQKSFARADALTVQEMRNPVCEEFYNGNYVDKKLSFITVRELGSSKPAK